MAAGISWVSGTEEKLMELMEVWEKKLGSTTLQTACDWPAAECSKTVAACMTFGLARAAYQKAPAKANHTEEALIDAR